MARENHDINWSVITHYVIGTTYLVYMLARRHTVLNRTKVIILSLQRQGVFSHRSWTNFSFLIPNNIQIMHCHYYSSFRHCTGNILQRPMTIVSHHVRCVTFIYRPTSHWLLVSAATANTFLGSVQRQQATGNAIAVRRRWTWYRSR